MKLLFIQGGTRLKITDSDNYYTDGNLNDKIWDRYKQYCDKLYIALRMDEKKYSESYAKLNLNPLTIDEKIEIVKLKDLMKPKYNFFSCSKRYYNKKILENKIKEVDKVIIRSVHNYYTLLAVKLCRKYKKEYLIEVAGYAFEGYWGHGDLYGKIVALYYELKAKKAIKSASHVVYVTNCSLQKRYKTNGKALGCSDVELNIIKKEDLNQKFKRFSNIKNKKIVVGTIGWVNLKLKGQQDVIKAIYNLRKKGIDVFEYQLVGLGNHEYLDSLIEKYKLTDCVKILGAKPHNEVFSWLETIDIYIQPSYHEGLCRAVIEAMSKACPIIVSNAGGNPELANEKFVFRKGNIKQIESKLTEMLNNLQDEAERSYIESKQYEKRILDQKRDEFYKKFIKE